MSSKSDRAKPKGRDMSPSKQSGSALPVNDPSDREGLKVQIGQVVVVPQFAPYVDKEREIEVLRGVRKSRVLPDTVPHTTIGTVLSFVDEILKIKPINREQSIFVSSTAVSIRIRKACYDE